MLYIQLNLPQTWVATIGIITNTIRLIYRYIGLSQGIFTIMSIYHKNRLPLP